MCDERSKKCAICEVPLSAVGAWHFYTPAVDLCSDCALAVSELARERRALRRRREVGELAPAPAPRTFPGSCSRCGAAMEVVGVALSPGDVLFCDKCAPAVRDAIEDLGRESTR